MHLDLQSGRDLAAPFKIPFTLECDSPLMLEYFHTIIVCVDEHVQELNYIKSFSISSEDCFLLHSWRFKGWIEWGMILCIVAVEDFIYSLRVLKMHFCFFNSEVLANSYMLTLTPWFTIIGIWISQMKELLLVLVSLRFLLWTEAFLEFFLCGYRPSHPSMAECIGHGWSGCRIVHQ